MNSQYIPIQDTASRGLKSARSYIVLLVIALSWTSLARADELITGKWYAWLESPGGRLKFGLDIEKNGDDYRAWIINGPERIEIPSVQVRDDESMFAGGVDIILSFDHYDSIITANWNGNRLEGEWVKTGAQAKQTRMSFFAVNNASWWRLCSKGAANRYVARNRRDLTGRWSVQFASSKQPAVAVFQKIEHTDFITGTFLTATGDYRYLAESSDSSPKIGSNYALELSCFDGAHAFLFKAELQKDGTLKGDFWSRDTWHETWTAKRDPDAKLPDAFGLTKWTGNATLSDLSFYDLEGTKRPLNDFAKPGTARIIEIFGSWCPNCNDATLYLMELDRKYRDRGLSIVGLAFELTGDRKRDTKQLKRYINHHNIKYPVLLAGVSSKTKASEALPIIDRVRSYPTFLFLDRAGDVRAIYTGFTGPATGEEYTKLRNQFESLIEEMLKGS